MGTLTLSLKRLAVISLAAMLVLCGCGSGAAKDADVTVCDFGGFSWDPSSEDAEEIMDELYLYICAGSSVSGVPSQEVEKMADSIEAFYVRLVEKQVEDYNSRGNDVSFEEMLHFLFNLDTREALRFFAESFARTEVKNRMVIRHIAEQESVTVTDAEFAQAKSEIEVSSYLSGDKDSEIRYEVLRRKVLRHILDTKIKH